MKQFLRKLFGRPLARTVRKALRPAARKADLGVERLDDRLLPSATAILSGSTLLINSDNWGASVTVDPTGPNNSNLQVTEKWGGTSLGTFSQAAVKAIQFTGTPHNDSFTNNTSIPSYIDGGAGNDTLIGGYGPDTLIGGAGDDDLEGRAGDDTYLFNLDQGGGADTLWEGSGCGNDTLDFSASQSTGLNLNGGLNLGSAAKQQVAWGQALTLGGGDFENVIGTGASDLITGNGLDNRLTGGFGDDILSGGDGNDTLSGGMGNNDLEGGAGNDTYLFNLDSAPGNNVVNEYPDQGYDTLDYSATTYSGLSLDLAQTATQSVHAYQNLTMPHNDVENVVGTQASDHIWGNRLHNYLRGMGGNDTLYGGSGNDTLYGGTGDDWYTFNPDQTDGSDVVVEGTNQGNDTLDFSLGGAVNAIQLDLNVQGKQQINPQEALTLQGDFENVIGTWGNDRIVGNALNNKIWGLGGNDVISGGDGWDYLDGGDGVNVITTDTNKADVWVDTVAASSGHSVVMADDKDCISTSHNTIIHYSQLATFGDNTYTFGIVEEQGFIFGTSNAVGVAVNKDGIYFYETSSKTFGVQAGAGVQIEYGCYFGGIDVLLHHTDYAVSGSFGLFGGVDVGASLELDSTGEVAGYTTSVGVGVDLIPFTVTFTYSSDTTVWDMQGHKLT